MTAAALLTAVMAATGWIAIPVGSVPVTLQVFGVALAALLLPPASAGLALGAYVLLGAAGVPVFAGGQAGLGVVFGPLGGYILGFLVGAVLGAWVRVAVARRFPAFVADVTAMVVVILVVYVLGWAWLAEVAHLSASQAFVSGVVPFVLPDAAKAAAAIVVARGVRRAGAVPRR
ncbi:MAG: biotin transporter BioY [Coriobacteriia bacterium]